MCAKFNLTAFAIGNKTKRIFKVRLQDHLTMNKRPISYAIELCVCCLLEKGLYEEGLLRVACGKHHIIISQFCILTRPETRYFKTKTIIRTHLWQLERNCGAYVRPSTPISSHYHIQANTKMRTPLPACSNHICAICPSRC